MRQTVLLYQFLYVAANAADNTLFQSGNIALRNTQNICYLFLRVFLIAGKPETHTDNLFFTRRQQSDGIVDQEALDTALDFLIDGIRFSPQNIRKKQLVAIPIRIESVSYTHLDVYKRQGMDIMILWCRKTGR